MSVFYTDQPINDEQAEGLYDAIFVGLGAGSQSLVAACDHTLKHVAGWCNATGVSFDQVKAWLRNHGGFCDCEVLYNVMPDEEEE